MLEPLLAQLTAANGPAGKHGIGLGGAARVRLYLNINNVQATDHHRGVAAAFDRHKSGILPVLVHGKKRSVVCCSGLDWGGARYPIVDCLL